VPYTRPDRHAGEEALEVHPQHDARPACGAAKEATERPRRKPCAASWAGTPSSTRSSSSRCRVRSRCLGASEDAHRAARRRAGADPVVLQRSRRRDPGPVLGVGEPVELGLRQPEERGQLGQVVQHRQVPRVGHHPGRRDDPADGRAFLARAGDGRLAMTAASSRGRSAGGSRSSSSTSRLSAGSQARRSAQHRAPLRDQPGRRPLAARKAPARAPARSSLTDRSPHPHPCRRERQRGSTCPVVRAICCDGAQGVARGAVPGRAGGLRGSPGEVGRRERRSTVSRSRCRTPHSTDAATVRLPPLAPERVA
jgi:hypothetical protein